MGCDIHCSFYREDPSEFVEISAPIVEDSRYKYEVFDRRSYALFGFLADVRNYSAVKPISQARGLPEWYIKERYIKELKVIDKPEWFYYEPELDRIYCGYHSHSWLTVKELLEFDYEQEIEDRRDYDNETCEVGQGAKMSYMEFLGEYYFKELALLENVGCTYIVFWFDN